MKNLNSEFWKSFPFRKDEVCIKYSKVLQMQMQLMLIETFVESSESLNFDKRFSRVSRWIEIVFGLKSCLNHISGRRSITCFNEHFALSKHSRDKSSLSGSNHLVYKFVSECRVSDKALLAALWIQISEICYDDC